VSANVAAGDILIVIIAKDNTGTTDGDFAEISGVSDSKGNTYTKAKEFTNGQGGAGSGATVSVWFSKITTALGTTDTVSATFASAITAKAMTLAEFSVAAGASLVVAASAATAGDAVSSVSTSITGLASQQYLFIAGDAYEGSGATKTESTGFTAIPSAGTTGGGAATNMMVFGAYQIATATGATYSPTFSASADIAQVLIAFQERLPQAFTANPTETLVLSDAIGRIYGAQRGPAESLILSDAMLRSYTGSRSFADSLALGDLIARLSTLTRSLSESSLLSDIAQGLRSFLENLADSTALSDTIGRIAALARSLGDSIGLSDLVKALNGAIAPPPQGLNVYVFSVMLGLQILLTAWGWRREGGLVSLLAGLWGFTLMGLMASQNFTLTTLACPGGSATCSQLVISNDSTIGLIPALFTIVAFLDIVRKVRA
jgi:hypothetical protein